ncbi:MAG: twin-arginine translocase subunit TatB [Piscirickettsiaceae bacterium]|nr:twin-arginine translocase subunit TatB [Piscirickettsiaceae bacterium]
MFDIGFWELLLIAIVALVVVGPERLPKLVRVTGLWVGKANASLQAVRSEISRELRAEELKQTLNKPIEDIAELQSILPTKETDKPESKDDNGKG